MSQAPRVHVAPRAGKTYGDLAGDLASDYGLTPDPWQQIVLDDWLSQTKGKWSSLTCGLSVPRQNGKNALIEVRELFGMVGRGEKFLHTAHEVKTARKAFKRLQHFFGTKPDDPGAKFPELNALVAEVRNVNGQEAILLHNGGSVEIVARSKNSARGFTVDVLIMDEAQEMSDDDLEALMPTTSSAPLENPQWIFTGTPPGPNANGEIFTRVREEALSGKANRLAWHEWSAEPDVSLDDREAWRTVNPALINGRLQFEVIEGERARFSDEGFARERLGMWSPGESHRSIIDPATWNAVADPASLPTERLTLAIDVAPNREVAAVSVAGKRIDDLWHVSLDEHRSGVDWVIGWVKQRTERRQLHAVVVDELAGLTETRYGLHYLKGTDIIVTLAASEGRDMAKAWATFHDAVTSATLRHTDQPQVNVALSQAGTRDLQGGRALTKKNSTADITPLTSQTLALWGAQRDDVQNPRRSWGAKTTSSVGGGGGWVM